MDSASLVYPCDACDHWVPAWTLRAVPTTSPGGANVLRRITYLVCLDGETCADRCERALGEGDDKW